MVCSSLFERSNYGIYLYAELKKKRRGPGDDEIEEVYMIVYGFMMQNERYSIDIELSTRVVLRE